MSAETLPSATAPVVLVHRYRHRVDVCAVLANQAVGWIARDVLEAFEGDPGDYADDPGHTPLVIAQHLHARTWTLDQAARLIAGDIRGNSLLEWMRGHEQSLADVGYGNVLRYGTVAHRLDDRTWSVATAAALLNGDPAIATGRQRLFDLLLIHGWITRHGSEYRPQPSAINGGLVGVVPRRKPHDGDPWPQVVITLTGLTELHRLLGGTDPHVLPRPERQP